MNLLGVKPEQLCEILHCDLSQGLSEQTVKQNRKEFGRNTPPPPFFTPAKIFKNLFSNVLFCIFYTLCVLSLFTADRTVALVCFLSSLFCLSVFYGYCLYASQNLRLFKHRALRPYRVLRDGTPKLVDITELVPGDLLLLRRSDALPCDGIILQEKSLRVMEVHVTGRQSPIAKCSYEKTQEPGEGAERRNKNAALLFCGSVLTSGSATVLVCNTGRNIQNCNKSLAAKQLCALPRPLRDAAAVSRKLSLVLLCTTILLFILGSVMDAEPYEIFYFSCALVVAALPELIDALCRLAMILPLSQLRKNGCLIQNYAALDKLLQANCIVVDSASYFLDSTFAPSSYFYANCPRSVQEVSEGLFKLLTYCRLCCEDKPDKTRQMRYGESSVDEAICKTAPDFGIDEAYLSHSYLTIHRNPYEETRGFAYSLVLENGKCYLLTRGRPTQILERCTHMLQEKRTIPLSDAAKARLFRAAQELAGANEVVVAVARRFYRSLPTETSEEDCSYLTFVGFLSFYTPMRAESAEAVDLCRAENVSVLLSTDNEPDATLGIAHNMELFEPGQEERILTAEALRRTGREDLQRELSSHKVFCALSPSEKRAVIEAHQKNGDIVIACHHQLTDCLPQENADVSVVLAEEQSNALVKNADILLDRARFELLPEAIRTSRTVFRNSLHILRYCLFIQIALFSSALFSLIFCGKTLFPPLAVLLLGLLVFLVCAICLAFDREKHPSLKPLSEKSFLHARLGTLILYACICGVTCGAACVFSFQCASLLSNNAPQAFSAAIVTLYFSVFFILFGTRSDTGIFKQESIFNFRVFFGLAATILICALLIYVPAVRIHLGLQPLSPLALLTSLLFSLLPVSAGEIYKRIHPRTKTVAD